MGYSKIALAAVTLISLAGCGVGTSSKYQGETTIGKYRVNWNKITSGHGSSKQTPLFFAFTLIDKPASLVTEANWEEEARQQNTTVAAVKTLYRSDVFPHRDGGVGLCMQMAIEEGLCGKREYPSTSEKAKMAEQALSTFATCRWIGFDPAFNAKMTYSAGASSSTLWIKADCS
jgi:hypothetical protein